MRRPDAKALVSLGMYAIPDLERALDSVEQTADRSPFAINAGWLALAYAKIEGPNAIARLRRMIDRPRQFASDESRLSSLKMGFG